MVASRARPHAPDRLPPRAAAGVLAAVALLLQVMFAAPVGLRMAVAATAAEAACLAPADGAAPRHDPAPHRHEQCPLCGSTVAPVAPPASTAAPPRSLAAWSVILPVAERAPAPQARLAAYASRAPPAA